LLYLWRGRRRWDPLSRSWWDQPSQPARHRRSPNPGFSRAHNKASCFAGFHVQPSRVIYVYSWKKTGLDDITSTAKTVNVPSMGDSITEGEVCQMLKSNHYYFVRKISNGKVNLNCYFLLIRNWRFRGTWRGGLQRGNG